MNSLRSVQETEEGTRRCRTPRWYLSRINQLRLIAITQVEPLNDKSTTMMRQDDGGEIAGKSTAHKKDDPATEGSDYIFLGLKKMSPKELSKTVDNLLLLPSRKVSTTRVRVLSTACLIVHNICVDNLRGWNQPMAHFAGTESRYRDSSDSDRRPASCESASASSILRTNEKYGFLEPSPTRKNQ